MDDLPAAGLVRDSLRAKLLFQLLDLMGITLECFPSSAQHAVPFDSGLTTTRADVAGPQVERVSLDRFSCGDDKGRRAGAAGEIRHFQKVALGAVAIGPGGEELGTLGPEDFTDRDARPRRRSLRSRVVRAGRGGYTYPRLHRRR